MKYFSKIALISAMGVSANAMALQSMADEALSATTAKDGIVITLNTTASGIDIEKLYLHDNDGLAPTNNTATLGYGGTGTAGALGVSDINIAPVDANGNPISGALAKVTIDVDAGTISPNAVNDSAFLNVRLELANVDISIGDITVGASNVLRGARRGTIGTETTILSGYNDTNKFAVSLGGSNLNIQLGNTPQGAVIALDGTLNGGLTLSNIALVDEMGGGVIGIDNVIITDANSTNLTADAVIHVVNNGINDSGLKVDLGNTTQDIYMQGVRLGGNYTTGATAISDASNVGTASFVATDIASIGDVEIQGLNLNNASVIIAGHN